MYDYPPENQGSFQKGQIIRFYVFFWPNSDLKLCYFDRYNNDVLNCRKYTLSNTLNQSTNQKPQI
jgi:hypothetical protein